MRGLFSFAAAAPSPVLDSASPALTVAATAAAAATGADPTLTPPITLNMDNGSLPASTPTAPPPVACLKSRPTLASTAKLFLPDQSSPILLAPSESEIHSDPKYYTFGAQLVAALVLFFIAYSLASIILNVIRRDERRRKSEWKEERKKQRAESEQARLNAVRMTLYHVAPMSAASSSSSPSPFTSSFDLSLSEPVPGVPSYLTRAKRKWRRYRLAMQNTIVRWKRRWANWRNATQVAGMVNKSRQRMTQQQSQLHHAHSNSQPTGSNRSASPPAKHATSLSASTIAQPTSSTTEPAPSLRKRLSNLIGLPSFLQHIQQSGAAVGRRSSPSIGGALTRVGDDLDLDGDGSDAYDAGLVHDLFDAFHDGGTLPWVHHVNPNAATAAASAASRWARRASITDRLTQWTGSVLTGGSAAATHTPTTPTIAPATPTQTYKAIRPIDAGSRIMSPILTAMSSMAGGGGTTAAAAAALTSFSLSSSAASSTSSHSHRRLRSGSPVRARSRSSSPLRDSDGSASSSSSSLVSSIDNDFPLQEASDANEREFLTYSLSTFVLAIGIVWIELLLLSILASTSLNGVALNQYSMFSWCTKDLVSTFWTCTIWLSSIALFVLAPFGFLYYEAEGIGGRKGFVSRVTETLLVLSAFTITLYGSFHLLYLLLDRCGLLQPFSLSVQSPITPTHAHAHAHASGLFDDDDSFLWADFDLFTILHGSLGMPTLMRALRTLYSNVWHFLPGLGLLLSTCHQGFIQLIARAYERATNSSHASPTAASSINGATGPSSSVGTTAIAAASVYSNDRIDALRLELATAERKWNEMEMDHARSRAHRDNLVRRNERDEYGGARRAINPAYAPSTAMLAKRQQLLSQISLLRSTLHAATLSRESRHPRTGVPFYSRVLGSGVLHRTVWMILTLGAILLTWHIIFRVAQREARLIFRGSIFRWFRATTASPEAEPMPTHEEGTFEFIIRNIHMCLYQIKTFIGTLLSGLTGKGLADKSTIHTPTPITTILPVTTHTAPLFGDSPILSGIWDVIRLLCSVLLGVNGFSSPGVVFLVDVLCIGFLLLASASVIYSSDLVQRFHPKHMYDPLAHAKERKEVGLFLPQYFTLGAVILLLLASALPIATWMLGLTSFDLLEFYPDSSIQFSSGPGATTVPLFVHLYNLLFLALTGVHVTRVSKQIVLYVIFDQIVMRIESLVERVRVRLGWSDRHARPEERFKLFGRCRRWKAGMQQRTKAGWTMHILQRCVTIIAWLSRPILRGMWFIAFHSGRILLHALQVLWTHVHAFVLGELEDDIDEDEIKLHTKSSIDDTKYDDNGIHTVDDSPVASSAIAPVRPESSLAAQLLAEVDRAHVDAGQGSTNDAAAASAAVTSAGIALAAGLMSPAHRLASLSTATGTAATTGGLHFFTRATSAPPRFQEGSNPTDSNDDDGAVVDPAALAGGGVDGADSAVRDLLSSPLTSIDGLLRTPPGLVDPSVGDDLTSYSPLYRSTTTAHHSTRPARSTSYFLTPGIVPSLSRKLSTDGHLYADHLRQSPLTERDFPIFSSPSDVDRIEEEKDSFHDLSPSSSASATPRYSPQLVALSPLTALSPLASRFLSADSDAPNLDLAAIDTSEVTPTAATRHRLARLESMREEEDESEAQMEEYVDDSISSDSSRDRDASPVVRQTAPGMPLSLPLSTLLLTSRELASSHSHSSSPSPASTPPHRQTPTIPQSTSSESDREEE